MKELRLTHRLFPPWPHKLLMRNTGLTSNSTFDWLPKGLHTM